MNWSSIATAVLPRYGTGPSSTLATVDECLDRRHKEEQPDPEEQTRNVRRRLDPVGTWLPPLIDRLAQEFVGIQGRRAGVLYDDLLDAQRQRVHERLELAQRVRDEERDIRPFETHVLAVVAGVVFCTPGFLARVRTRAVVHDVHAWQH